MVLRRVKVSLENYLFLKKYCFEKNITMVAAIDRLVLTIDNKEIKNAAKEYEKRLKQREEMLKLKKEEEITKNYLRKISLNARKLMFIKNVFCFSWIALSFKLSDKKMLEENLKISMNYADDMNLKKAKKKINELSILLKQYNKNQNPEFFSKARLLIFSEINQEDIEKFKYKSQLLKR